MQNSELEELYDIGQKLDKIINLLERIAQDQQPSSRITVVTQDKLPECTCNRAADNLTAVAPPCPVHGPFITWTLGSQ